MPDEPEEMTSEMPPCHGGCLTVILHSRYKAASEIGIRGVEGLLKTAPGRFHLQAVILYPMPGRRAFLAGQEAPGLSSGSAEWSVEPFPRGIHARLSASRLWITRERPGGVPRLVSGVLSKSGRTAAALTDFQAAGHAKNP